LTHDDGDDDDDSNNKPPVLFQGPIPEEEEDEGDEEEDEEEDDDDDDISVVDERATQKTPLAMRLSIPSFHSILPQLASQSQTQDEENISGRPKRI
jgi:hypothetical protein